MQIHDFEISDEPNDEQTEAFRIDSEAAANWYLRRLANIQSEKTRVQAQAVQIVKQLDADAATLRYLYESQLQEFVRQELAKKGNRRKSLPFLQGTCQFRTVPAGIKVSDPNAALNYARLSLPDAVRSVETLDTDKYREKAEAALKNGELLPGTLSIPERESFTVKFGRKGD